MSDPQVKEEKLLTVREVMDAVESCSTNLRGMKVLDVPRFYDKIRGVETPKPTNRKPPIR